MNVRSNLLTSMAERRCARNPDAPICDPKEKDPTLFRRRLIISIIVDVFQVIIPLFLMFIQWLASIFGFQGSILFEFQGIGVITIYAGVALVIAILILGYRGWLAIWEPVFAIALFGFGGETIIAIVPTLTFLTLIFRAEEARKPK